MSQPVSEPTPGAGSSRQPAPAPGAAPPPGTDGVPPSGGPDGPPPSRGTDGALASGGPAGSGLRRLRRGTNRLLVGSDLALGYAGVVTVLAVLLTLLPDRMSHRFVLDSSTNLVNLRSHPPFVLFVSAFVEPSIWQLWILLPMLVVYGALQRWLGRAAVVITAVLGHVGATLFVATILSAGIAHGRAALSQARAADVGVSYGLVAAAGLLVARLPARWVPWYATGLTAVFAVMLLVWRGFTDLGHLSAWLIGLGLAVLVDRAQRIGVTPDG